MSVVAIYFSTILTKEHCRKRKEISLKDKFTSGVHGCIIVCDYLWWCSYYKERAKSDNWRRYNRRIDLNVERSSTDDCVTFVCEDLDNAASLLPSVWADPSVNYGRVTKGAAMALKDACCSFMQVHCSTVPTIRHAGMPPILQNKAAYDELTTNGRQRIGRCNE